MHCSYRILKNVNIGQRVRKTADKNTVAFDNEPFSGAKILRYDHQGFQIGHESLPKDLWLDFNQLPLCTLTIKNGIIEDEITFVESIVGGSTTSMVLLKTATFDYQELLEDKLFKDNQQKFKATELIPGEVVSSAICKESVNMVFLGRFFVAECVNKGAYSYRGSDGKSRYYIDKTPERAFFAIDDGSGKYSIKEYPITNKIVAELYKEGINDALFTNQTINLDMIRYAAYHNKDTYYWQYITFNTKPTFDFIKNHRRGFGLYVDTVKKDIRTKAIAYAKENLGGVTCYKDSKVTPCSSENYVFFENDKVYQDDYSKRSRY